VPCAFAILSTITAQPARQSRKCTCGAGISRAANFDSGLAAGFTFADRRAGAAFRVVRALVRRVVVRVDVRVVLRAVLRDDLRDVRVAVIFVSFPRRAGNLPTTTSPVKSYYPFSRRWTIILLPPRFRRVFAPNVGKPHGVCGWLPFTRPSPPP